MTGNPLGAICDLELRRPIWRYGACKLPYVHAKKVPAALDPIGVTGVPFYPPMASTGAIYASGSA